jgi:hypothetical protein
VDTPLNLVRKNFLVLTAYILLVVLLVVSEKMVGATNLEMMAFIVGSLVYVGLVLRNHWVAGTPGTVGTTKLNFIGIAILFIFGGLIAGVIAGVNAKFLLGLGL